MNMSDDIIYIDLEYLSQRVYTKEYDEGRNNLALEEFMRKEGGKAGYQAGAQKKE